MTLDNKNRELFLSYCNKNKAAYLPIKGTFYGLNFTSCNNISISKNNGGAILVNESVLLDIEKDINKFLTKNTYFIYNKKKAKNIKTLFQNK